MRLGIVVPRFGPVVGGVEHALKRLAENLVTDLGWSVDVFTTRAVSAATWHQELPEGTTVENGVSVHRFTARGSRDPRFGELHELIDHPGALDQSQQRNYFEWQGPFCPEVLDAAAESNSDRVAFAPFLFWPSVAGIPRLGPRSIVHGAVHDEPVMYLSAMAASLSDAGAFCFNSRAEQALVSRHFSVAHLPQLVLGYGMEEPPRPAPDTAAKYGLDETPYVVCLGRVELGKGAGALHKAFLAYKQRRPRPLRLVFVGPDLEHFVDDPDIVMTGAVDEAEKWDLLRGSEFCISPSAMESFSFVVLEAWQAGVPVLVNRRCDATVEHALRGRGGLWFDDYPSFEATMDRLIADADLRERLAANGLAYAEANFDWHVLVRRYAAFLEGLSPAGPVLPSAS